MIVRAAEAVDLPTIHALVERAYRGDAARAGWTHEADMLDGQRTDPAALAALLADPAERLLLAWADDTLVGCVAVRLVGSERAYLGLLTVDPSRQAGGLGRAVLAAAEDNARERGATIIEMTVIAQRSELIAWYERRGYALTGEERPFPLDDPRFGLPKTRDLKFVVLEKRL